MCSSVQFIHRHWLDRTNLQKHCPPKLQPVEVFGSKQQINYFASLDCQLAKYSCAYLKSYFISDFMQQIYGCYHDKHYWLSCYLGSWELFLGYSLISDLFCCGMKLLEFCNYNPKEQIYNNLSYLHFISYFASLHASLKYLCFKPD